jgi:hypothetical protein
MERLPALLALTLFLNHYANAQAIVVNSDGTHSIVVSNGNSSTIVNSNGTHSTLFMNGNTGIMVNPDGTHSTIVTNGNISTVINQNGTHSIIINNEPASASVGLITWDSTKIEDIDTGTISREKKRLKKHKLKRNRKDKTRIDR